MIRRGAVPLPSEVGSTKTHNQLSNYPRTPKQPQKTNMWTEEGFIIKKYDEEEQEEPNTIKNDGQTIKIHDYAMASGFIATLITTMPSPLRTVNTLDISTSGKYEEQERHGHTAPMTQLLAHLHTYSAGLKTLKLSIFRCIHPEFFWSVLYSHAATLESLTLEFEMCHLLQLLPHPSHTTLVDRARFAALHTLRINAEELLLNDSCALDAILRAAGGKESRVEVLELSWPGLSTDEPPHGWDWGRYIFPRARSVALNGLVLGEKEGRAFVDEFLAGLREVRELKDKACVPPEGLVDGEWRKLKKVPINGKGILPKLEKLVMKSHWSPWGLKDWFNGRDKRPIRDLEIPSLDLEKTLATVPGLEPDVKAELAKLERLKLVLNIESWRKTPEPLYDSDNDDNCIDFAAYHPNHRRYDGGSNYAYDPDDFFYNSHSNYNNFFHKSESESSFEPFLESPCSYDSSGSDDVADLDDSDADSELARLYSNRGGRRRTRSEPKWSNPDEHDEEALPLPPLIYCVTGAIPYFESLTHLTVVFEYDSFREDKKQRWEKGTARQEDLLAILSIVKDLSRLKVLTIVEEHAEPWSDEWLAGEVDIVLPEALERIVWCRGKSWEVEEHVFEVKRDENKVKKRRKITFFRSREIKVRSREMKNKLRQMKMRSTSKAARAKYPPKPEKSQPGKSKK